MAVSVAEGKNAQNATTAAATTAVFPATTTNTGVVVVLPLGCFLCWCQLCW